MLMKDLVNSFGTIIYMQFFINVVNVLGNSAQGNVQL